MTTATFFMEGNRIAGFDISGHSGYADEGGDIVCAAVTSAVRLVEATVNDVFGLSAAVKIHKKSGSVSLRLPVGLSDRDEHAAQGLLSGLMLHFSSLHDEYPDNIEVLEA